MQDVDLDFLSPRTPPPPRILGELTFLEGEGGHCHLAPRIVHTLFGN